MTIEHMDYYIKEMKKYSDKYPDAQVYFDTESAEVRIVCRPSYMFWSTTSEM